MKAQETLDYFHEDNFFLNKCLFFFILKAMWKISFYHYVFMLGLASKLISISVSGFAHGHVGSYNLHHLLPCSIHVFIVPSAPRHAIYRWQNSHVWITTKWLHGAKFSKVISSTWIKRETVCAKNITLQYLFPGRCHRCKNHTLYFIKNKNKLVH